MAKKSIKKTATAKPSKAKNSKPNGVKSVAKKIAKRLGATSTPLHEETIGHDAGEIWKVLHAGGPQTLAGLKKLANLSGDNVSAAVGWLAREGKLHFDTSGRSVKVSLRG